MASNSSSTPFESFSSSLDKVTSWLKEAISTEEPKSESEDGPSTVEMFWPSRVNRMFRSLRNKQHSECTTGSTSPAISCSSTRSSTKARFIRSPLPLSSRSTSTPSLIQRYSSYRRTLEKRRRLAEFYQRRDSPCSSPRHPGIEQEPNIEEQQLDKDEVSNESETVIDISRLNIAISTSSCQRENKIDGASYSQRQNASATDKTTRAQSFYKMDFTGYSRQQSEPTADKEKNIKTVGANTSPIWYRQDSGFEDERETLDVSEAVLENPTYDYLYREQTKEISAADPYRVIRRLTLNQAHGRNFKKHMSMNAITHLLTGINADMNYPKISLSIQYFMSTKELRVCFSEAKMLDTLSPSDRNSLVYMKTYVKPGKNAQKRTSLIQLSPSISMNDKIYFKKIEADDLSECSLVVKVFKKRRYVPIECIYSYFSLVLRCQINPYKPSVLFVGHRQTVQTQIVFRCQINQYKPSVLF